MRSISAAPTDTRGVCNNVRRASSLGIAVVRMSKRRTPKGNSWLSDVSAGSGGMFVLVFVGLFLMLVSGTCAETSAAYLLESDDMVERLVSVVLSLVAMLIGAALTTAVLSAVAQTVSIGYRALLDGQSDAANPWRSVAIGLGTLVISAGLGGWRLHAGYARGEPGWVMQGTLVGAVGVIVGLMLIVPHFALALRSAAPSGKARTKPPASADDGWPTEAVFVFLAVLGLVMSFGVVEYVHIARAQAGNGPLPLGELVDGWVRTDGFQGYPEQTELVLPEHLDGPHGIVFVEVSPCVMHLTRDDDARVPVRRIDKKQDADGDTIEYARLVFDAQPEHRYTLRLTPNDKSCLYSLRLIREQT